MFSQENTSSDVGVFCVFMSDPQIRLQYHVKVEAISGFFLALTGKNPGCQGHYDAFIFTHSCKSLGEVRQRDSPRVKHFLDIQNLYFYR